MIFLMRSHKCLALIALLLLASLACSGIVTPVPTLDPNAVQTIIVQTVAAQATDNTPTAKATVDIPTNTPKATNTPGPTNTAQPSPTPIVGTFRFPLHIGDSIKLPGIPDEYRKDPSNNGGEVEFQLLEAKRGQDAKAEAQRRLNQFAYQDPISGQEYVAIRGFLRMLSYIDTNQVASLYPYWHLTLRYEDGGSDIWSVDPVYSIAEGYAPLEGEFWIFFLIREN